MDSLPLNILNGYTLTKEVGANLISFFAYWIETGPHSTLGKKFWHL